MLPTLKQTTQRKQGESLDPKRPRTTSHARTTPTLTHPFTHDPDQYRCKTFMHTREALGISLNISSSKRTSPCNVVRTSTESESHENNVFTRRLTHLFIHEDDDTVRVHCRYNHFSECLTFLFSSVVAMSTSRPAGVCGRRILLNTLSALKTTIMSLWPSPDTVLIWNLTRK